MSRIGKQPVDIPGGVTVKVVGREVAVTGPKGTLTLVCPSTAEVLVDSNAKQVRVNRVDDRKQSRANQVLRPG